MFNINENLEQKTPQHDKIMDYLIDNDILSNIANIIIHYIIDKCTFTENGQKFSQEKVTFDKNDEWKKYEEFLVDKYHFRYIDLHATLTKRFVVAESIEKNEKTNTKDFVLNIEVKTTIPSVGSLIRQINTYRSFSDGYYVVITPSENINESLKNRLSNSNIYLIGTKQLDIVL